MVCSGSSHGPSKEIFLLVHLDVWSGGGLRQVQAAFHFSFSPSPDWPSPTSLWRWMLHRWVRDGCCLNGHLKTNSTHVPSLHTGYPPGNGIMMLATETSWPLFWNFIASVIQWAHQGEPGPPNQLFVSAYLQAQIVQWICKGKVMPWWTLRLNKNPEHHQELLLVAQDRSRYTRFCGCLYHLCPDQRSPGTTPSTTHPQMTGVLCIARFHNRITNLLKNSVILVILDRLSKICQLILLPKLPSWARITNGYVCVLSLWSPTGPAVLSSIALYLPVLVDILLANQGIGHLLLLFSSQVHWAEEEIEPGPGVYSTLPGIH